MARGAPSAARLALLAAAIVWIAAVRANTRQPHDRDVATYAVMAHEMLLGADLYTDIFDHKPPAIYGTYAAAELAAGYGRRSVFLLYLAGSLVVLAGLYRFSRRTGTGTASLLPLLVGGLAMSSLTLESVEPNSELFINGCLTWAFVLCAAPPALAGRRLAGAAALVALASLYKHVAVVPGALFIAARVVLDAAENREWRRAAGRLAAAGGVVAGAWAATFLYFSATGRGMDFFDTMTRYNVGYAGLGGSWLSRAWPKLAETLATGPVIAVLLAATALAALALARVRGKHRRTARLLLAYVAGAAVAVALPGQFFPHYFQLLIPPVAMAAAICAAGAFRRWAIAPPATAIGAAVLVAFLAADSVAAYRITDAGLRARHGERYTPAEALAAEINGLLRPGETFFDWGNEAWLYFYTGRRPAAGVFFADHARTSALADRVAGRAVAQLKESRPEIVVVSRWRPDEKVFGNPVGRWIKHHYVALPGHDHGFLYLMARRDGRLNNQGGT